MCVFCAAIPTAAVTGMALDQKERRKNNLQRRAFYLRPFIVLTLLIVVFLMAASVYFHNRNLA